MKRRAPLVMRIGLFLLLGAIVNVAVAWGCARWSMLVGKSVAPALMYWDAQERWVVVVESCGIGLVHMRVGGFYSLLPDAKVSELPRWSRLGSQRLVQEGNPDSRVVTRCTEIAAGWPLVVLFGYRATKPSVEHGIDISNPGDLISDGRLIPLCPLWPGFAINTVLYAGILWVLFAAPFVLRRRRRVKRGLCPKCAYPVGVSEVCTECGTAVSRSAQREG